MLTAQQCPAQTTNVEPDPDDPSDLVVTAAIEPVD
jgi:hypothetical protein